MVSQANDCMLMITQYFAPEATVSFEIAERTCINGPGRRSATPTCFRSRLVRKLAVLFNFALIYIAAVLKYSGSPRCFCSNRARLAGSTFKTGLHRGHRLS